MRRMVLLVDCTRVRGFKPELMSYLAGSYRAGVSSPSGVLY